MKAVRKRSSLVTAISFVNSGQTFERYTPKRQRGQTKPYSHYLSSI